jgi:heavy metal sensor kinase
MRLRPRHVRMRLTLWYVAVLGGVLALYVAGSSAFLLLHLRHQLDTTLADQVEQLEPQLSFTPNGSLRIAPIVRDEADDPGHSTRQYLEIRSLDGSVLYRTELLGGAIEPDEGQNGYSQRSSRLKDGTRVRLASRRHAMGDRTVLIRLALTEEPLWHSFREMLFVMLLGVPMALAVAGLGGYALARRTLKPLDTMARRAEQIGADRLHDRLPVDNPDDELGYLARVFNDALTRLEGSFEQLRRFTADASHELRTPLTAIRSVGEVGLKKEGPTSYYVDIIGSMLEEANRLTRLVESLLTISRADAGHVPINRADFRLMDLVREAAGLLDVLVEEKNQTLVVEGNPELMISADRMILRQAFVNIIDNAVKYSPFRGTIRILISATEAEAIVDVQDEGPGIAPAHQARVFDRFYRVDKSRSRDAGGAGLGLSIVKWAVDANAGRIELISRENEGSTFRIRLPLVKTFQNATVMG